MKCKKSSPTLNENSALVKTKFEARNPKFETNKEMPEINKVKPYDLEDRTFRFAQNVRLFVRALPRTMTNIEDGKQLVRSSGSVGANYIEANESLGQKDFKMRIKICRKEAKESIYWLRLIDAPNTMTGNKTGLINEATELMKIFSAIMRKCE